MRVWLASLFFAKTSIALIVFCASSHVIADVQQDFFWAIDQGNASQAAKLLQQNVDIDLVNPEGYTPLMVAAKTNNFPLANLLLEKGANVNIRNKYRETAIMLASYHGQTDMVKLLHSHGADIHHAGWNPLLYAATNGHMATMRWLLDEKADVNAPSDNGTTPLMMAVRGNHVDAVQLLLSRGADMRRKNEQGENALDWAKKRDYPRIVQLLDSHGASK